MMRISLIVILSMYLNVGIGQSYTSYFTGDTANAQVQPLGGVCLMGGASENDDAMKWFLQNANGGDVVVIRASGSDGYNNYFYSQLGVNINSVETIVFNNGNASNNAYVKRRIAEAEAIWMAGGDQWDYVSYWRGTAIDSIINFNIENKNMTIGGTSAGMAVLGGVYFSAENGSVTSASALANPYNYYMTVDSTPFLKAPFMSNVITDTHYDSPDRSGRHVAFIAKHLQDTGEPIYGIACDEYTSVCIDTNGIARAYGEHPAYDDNVYFIQVNCRNINLPPQTCTSGQPLEWNYNQESIKVFHAKGTANGSQYLDLKDWKTYNGGTWEDWYVVNGNLTKVNGDTLDCTIISTEEALEIPVSIFPNPVVSNALNIQTEEPITQLYIYNTLGQMIYQQQDLSGDLNQIETTDWENGLYIIELHIKSTRYQQTILKLND